MVHCGDYIYESDRGAVRPIDDEPPTTLDEYRAIWRRYKAEPELQAAHAVAPWLMVWDDHEVENNYQGVAPGDPPGGARRSSSSGPPRTGRGGSSRPPGSTRPTGPTCASTARSTGAA